MKVLPPTTVFPQGTSDTTLVHQQPVAFKSLTR